MTVEELVMFAVMTFGLQPSEAWSLSPKQNVLCWEHYKRANGVEQKQPYTKTDLKRLEYKIARCKRTENKN